MRKDYLAVSDGALLTWSANFLHRLQADAMGLPAEQIALYQSRHEGYAQALDRSTAPRTRTRVTLVEKDEQRSALKSLARVMAQVLRANPDVSQEQLIGLGLSPRPVKRSRISPPDEAPSLAVVDTQGRRMMIKLRGRHTIGRGKPRGARAAIVMTYVGDKPPSDLGQWRLLAHTTRTRVMVEYPPSVPAGAVVWICGQWVSDRREAGPMCPAVCACIGGVVAPAA